MSLASPDVAPANPDRALLAACQKGEAMAWEQLLIKYERLVFSVARNCGLPPEDAADVTQITFTYLMQSLAAVNAEHLGGWLATVARRHSWRLLKQRNLAANDEVDLEMVDTLRPNHPAPSAIERWEVTEWLHEGLTLLNERCRELLLALYFDVQEPAYKVIAESLGIPEGSIGPTRARCLKQLRTLLEDKK